jgi:AcrR family transcriptional regulator
MAERGRDSAQSRAAILGAARLQFGTEGFDRTTIRSVAAAAGVDPALVMHYFGSKDGLFRAAAELDLDLPDLTGVPPDRVADVLLPRFVAAWRPGGPFLGLLRASTSNPTAAQALLDVLAQQVTPALAAVARDQAPRRAALVGSQLLGIAVARFVLQVPPIVELSDAELVDWLRPVIAHYLSDPAPGV